MNKLLQKLLLVCTILFLILKTTTATAQVDVLETLRYGLTHTHSAVSNKKHSKKKKSKKPKTKQETLDGKEKKLFTGRFSLLYTGDNLTINQIQYALDHGAVINTKYTATPLMYAIKYKRDPKIIEFLINHGANVNDKVDNQTPLSYVMRYNGSIDILQLLFKNGAKIDKNNRLKLLFTAIMKNKHAKIVDFLLKLDPTMIDQRSNMFYNSNYTPLELAIEHGTRTAEVLETLLKYESPDKLHDNVSSLLEKASYVRNDTVIATLLKHGANINYHNKENGRTPLMNAIASASLPMVKALLKHGASVNSKSNQGMTPLMWALVCYHDDNSIYHSAFPKMINLLLEHKQNLNAENNAGETPLMLASYSRPLVNLLVKQGAKLNFKTKKGDTLLSYAIGKKNSHSHDPKFITFLLKHGLKFNNNNSIYEWNYLVDSYNYLQTLPTILKHKINIHARDQYGETLLNHMAGMCKIKPLALLLKHGAKVNTISIYNATPFTRSAIACKDISILKLFLKYGAKVNNINYDNETALVHAVENENYDLVAFLLKHGANPHVKGVDSVLTPRYTYSPYVKMKNSFVNMANFLLIHGVKFAKNEKYRWDVLTYSKLSNATSKERLAQLEFLIKHGANINAKGEKSGQTLLLYALIHIAKKEDISLIVKLLLNNGANPHIKSTALYYSSRSYTPFTYTLTQIDNLNVLEVFFKNGIKINSKDENGWTPLMWACRYSKSPKVIDYLLLHGADINAKTTDGQTPLSLSKNNPSNEVSEFLRDHGAKK